MTQQIAETAQFFLTAPSPCPYLEGKEERKLFTYLNGKRATMVHQTLSEHGFRRSQSLIYRPTCQGCNACQSARVVVKEFEARQRHRRVMKKNADLNVHIADPVASKEQYELFSNYLNHRHKNGGMAQMSFEDYEFMLEDTPVDSVVVEYRLPGSSDEAGQLVAVALSDVMADGFSMVYSFFDPQLSERGLGNFMVLEHINRAARTDLSYVYLGYWVQQSPKMRYKAGFRPLEVQSQGAGWQRLI
ncbi:Arginyl-tRNA--protein transferase [hydrothermal vent metagenome]|uniref:Arginyl-tRNA--protein transferase n=1 Tax=hydrothermal vent metagenome TaxID=652676 RepID=A0A3B0UKQ3_9ZZZZ